MCLKEGLGAFTHHCLMAEAFRHDSLEWKDVPMQRKPGPTAVSHSNTVTQTDEEGANKNPLICHIHTLQSWSSKYFWKQHCLHRVNEKSNTGWHFEVPQWFIAVTRNAGFSSSPSQSHHRTCSISVGQADVFITWPWCPLVTVISNPSRLSLLGI